MGEKKTNSIKEKMCTQTEGHVFNEIESTEEGCQNERLWEKSMNDDHRILFELPQTAPPTFHPHNLMLQLFSHHLIAVLH